MLRSANACANTNAATAEIGSPSEDGDSPPNHQRQPFHTPVIRRRTCWHVAATIAIGSSSSSEDGDGDVGHAPQEPSNPQRKLVHASIINEGMC
jgi:hypothetical protein